jgi:ABC-type transport system involved in cytochrome bd biosynthesis fused ATPase/permease subunit
MYIIFKIFKWKVALLILLTAVSVILEMGFLSNISDILKEGVNSELLYYVIAIFSGKVILQILLSYYQPFLAFSILEYLSFSIYSISTNFFRSKEPLSTVIRNCTTESDHAVMGFILPLISLLVDVITAVAIIGILTHNIGIILIYVLVAGLLLLLIVSYFSTLFLNNLGKIRQANESLRLREVKSLYGLSTELKFIGDRSYFHQKYKKYLSLIARSGRLTSFFQQLPKNIIEILGLFIFGVLYLFIKDDPGQVVVTFGLLAIAATRLVPAVSRIFTAVYTLSYSYPAYHLIVDIIKSDIFNKENTQHISKVTSSGAMFTILCGIDSSFFKSNFQIEVQKNKLNVITGISGSGKTTLLKEVAQSFLEFGSLQDYKGVYVSYMPQDSKLFEATLIDNLILSDGSVNSSYDFNHIKKIFSLLSIKYLLERDGFAKYEILDDAKNLSGGEARRVCLARHLLSKPSILLLDEPTTGLDKESEREIFNLLKEVSIDTTLLIISHSETIIKGADNVININEKKLVKI